MGGKTIEYDEKLEQTQQRFQEFYQQNLKNIYIELEKERRKNLYLLGRNLLIIFGTVLFFVTLFYFHILSERIWEQRWFGYVVAILLLVFAYLIYQPFGQYNDRTKKQTMNKILSFWGKFRYSNGNSVVSGSTIKKSELFSYFTQSQSEDAFFGNYRNTSVNVSEHDLRIKGRKGDVIIFKGVIIQLGLSLKFKGKTIVFDKWRNLNFLLNNHLLTLLFLMIFGSIGMSLKYSFLSQSLLPVIISSMPMLITIFIFWLIYRIYRHYHPKIATQKVLLEGLSFMRRWSVLTDNQIEARYLLTPVFMEKMMAIKRFFHGKFIDFSFFDNKLLIAIHTRKDMFETTSLFTSALDYRRIYDVVGQLQSIFAVIDLILDKDTK